MVAQTPQAGGDGMNLPKLPNHINKVERSVINFGGLNFSDTAKDGEFAACKNLSGRRLPYLTQRPGRIFDETYADPDSVFAWDGKMVVAAGGKLYYDGAELCSVNGGQKQFAVVNSKLVVWPDKVMVDLVEKTARQMSPQVKNNGTATFTENTLTLVPKPVYATAVCGRYSDPEGMRGPWAWTYSNVKWTEEGGWELEGAELTSLMMGNPSAEGRYYIPEVKFNEATQTYSFERITTATPQGQWSAEQPDKALYPETAPGNDLGFYGKIYFDPTANNEVNISGPSRCWFNGEMHWAQQENNADLSQLFSVGDYISVSGATNEANNDKFLKVTAVTATMITVEGSPFVAGNDTASITVRTEVPDMDFICEKDNRLWGCSNSQKAHIYNAETDTYHEVTSRVIYSSALGQPDRFWDFDGLSTDSYQVAVASEGDFTGIANYGGGVLCFKENELLKVLGGYPAEYTMYTYHIAGVEQGCHKSVVNINERLFYKGRAGVYAYAGGTPTLLTEKFGNHAYRDAVAATDGIRYYISMREGEQWSLFTYDTLKGLWFREDDTHAADMCSVLGEVVILTDDGKLFRPDGDPAESVEWMVQFAPFYEVPKGRKSYPRIDLRMEMTGYVKVETRMDDSPVWTTNGVFTGGKTVTAPIRPGRCDKFEIRISGKGTCTILSMVREFRAGG